MKWWYVLVLLVGVGIGWWFLANYGVKSSTPVSVIEQDRLIKALNDLPTVITQDKFGVKRDTVNVGGIVQSWDSENGLLEFMRDNKLWKLNIDPESMIIFVVNVSNKNNVISINDKSNVHWNTAFCVGDRVSLRLTSTGQLIFIDNDGNRSCGFKGN